MSHPHQCENCQEVFSCDADIELGCGGAGGTCRKCDDVINQEHEDSPPAASMVAAKASLSGFLRPCCATLDLQPHNLRTCTAFDSKAGLHGRTLTREEMAEACEKVKAADKNVVITAQQRPKWAMAQLINWVQGAVKNCDAEENAINLAIGTCIPFKDESRRNNLVRAKRKWEVRRATLNEILQKVR